MADWKKYGVALILLLVLTANDAFAQRTTDFGAILQAEYENNFVGNYDVWVKEDLRFDHDFSKYSRSKTTLETVTTSKTNNLKK